MTGRPCTCTRPWLLRYFVQGRGVTSGHSDRGAGDTGRNDPKAHRTSAKRKAKRHPDPAPGLVYCRLYSLPLCTLRRTLELDTELSCRSLLAAATHAGKAPAPVGISTSWRPDTPPTRRAYSTTREIRDYPACGGSSSLSRSPLGWQLSGRSSCRAGSTHCQDSAGASRVCILGPAWHILTRGRVGSKLRHGKV